jgi:DNA-binding NtrC family response regulator
LIEERCPVSIGRVLIVDDEPLVVSTARDLLQYFGYEVSTAASAEEAFASMNTVRSQIVLLDLHLRGTSGLQALKSFRELYPTVPVIVATGDIQHRMAQEARDSGAFEVISKPFNLTVLRSLLARAMTLAPPQ